LETVKVLVTGKVQGVSYRHSAARMARQLGLRGWVQNRDDGAVEALLQGEPDHIDRMLAWMRSGPPAARVQDVLAETLSIEKRFESFMQL
jgi:acylphosphatase